MKKKVHQVKAKAQSIASRILEMKEALIVGRKVTLMELVTTTEERARQVLITFLSLLELGKMGFVGLYQSEAYTDIWVDPKKPIETDVLARVEEYDSMRADEVAAKMMEDSKKLSQEDLVDLSDETAATAASADGNAEESLQLDFQLADESFIEDVEIPSEDMASDDEIFAAEQELEKDGLVEV
jgi:segregation and condensation protein A